MTSTLFFSETGLMGSNQVLKCCHSTISLMIFKQLVQIFSAFFSISRKAVYYLLSILYSKKKVQQIFAHVSIKKLGQGGEYLYFSVKKKFYALVFLVIKIAKNFAGFCVENLEN